MLRAVRSSLCLLAVTGVAIATAGASNFKTVCASGCDYTSLQSAINAVPTRSTPGDGASSPWVIQVQIGVHAVSTSLTVSGKSYLTIEGVGETASIVQADATWFSNATSAPAEQFLTISDSDHITLRNITIDATTNAPSNLTLNQSGGGIAAVFLQGVNPIVIDDATMTAFEWGLRDANPGSSDPANNNNLEMYDSRVESQYVAGWMTGGSTWLVWNTTFRAEGDLTANTPPSIIDGFYVTGALPVARNVFTCWGCHFHGESPAAGTLRGVEVSSPRVGDVNAFVGCTLHAKSKATSPSTNVSVTALLAFGASAASVDITGSELVYEGLPTATSGNYVGISNNTSKVIVNLTGSSIIDRARDDSTTPPTLAGTTHKDILRGQGPGGSFSSPVRVTGSRAISITGHSTSVPQSIDNVENQAGTATLSGGTATVTLPATLPSNKYRVTLSGSANETFWISSKTATGFTISSSNGGSVATVDWIVRF